MSDIEGNHLLLIRNKFFSFEFTLIGRVVLRCSLWIWNNILGKRIDESIPQNRDLIRFPRDDGRFVYTEFLLQEDADEEDETTKSLWRSVVVSS
jgi:hypothetical protein